MLDNRFTYEEKTGTNKCVILQKNAENNKDLPRNQRRQYENKKETYTQKEAAEILQYGLLNLTRTGHTEGNMDKRSQRVTYLAN